MGKPCPLCALLLDCPAGETRRRHQFDWGGRCGGGSGIAPPAGGAGVVARPHLYYNRGIRRVFSHRLPCGKPSQANLWIMWSRLRPSTPLFVTICAISSRKHKILVRLCGKYKFLDELRAVCYSTIARRCFYGLYERATIQVGQAASGDGEHAPE